MSCSGPEVMGAQGLVSREGGPSLLPLSPPTWQAETRGKATSHLLSPDEGPSSTWVGYPLPATGPWYLRCALTVRSCPALLLFLQWLCLGGREAACLV